MRRGGYLSLGIKDVFDPKGRIDRLTYFMYGCILRMMQVVLMFAVAAFLSAISGQIPEALKPYPVTARLIVCLPVFYGAFCIQAKRLHDIGLPATLAVIGLSDIVLTAGMEIAPHVTTVPAALATNAPMIAEDISWGVLAFHLLLLLVPGKRGANRYGKSATGEELPRPRMLEG